MTSLQHPASLNVLQQYRQACAILQNTSRATRPEWYKEALELNYQFHIVIDGPSILTFFYQSDSNTWTSGVPINDEVFLDIEKAKALGRNLIQKVTDLKGRQLGVIIHAADEFATTEIKQKFNNPSALADLREIIHENPREVLEDSSAMPDQSTWRVMPYPASGSPVIATTITLSRRLETFVTALRDLGNDENFPLITHVLSAPLVAIMGLPDLIPEPSQKPFVAVLQYPWFTAMAFFNEHADLRLIRSLQHRGQRCPANFWSSLATTNASLEFVDPNIYLLPLGEQMDLRISEDLKRNFPNSSIETVYFPQTNPLPVWLPEPVLSVSDTDNEGKIKSHTFGILRSERWFLQDFLSPSAQAQALFPSRSEIRLLRYFNLAKRAIFALVILVVLFLSLDVYRIISQPEWAFEKNETGMIQQRMGKLQAEKKRLEHWNVLLDDRSRAWTAMELVARIFPEKSDTLLKGFIHTVRPDAAPKQLKAGFIKEWKLNGFARNEAMIHLNKINSREGITAKFADMANTTGDASFDPTPKTRSIIVNLKTKENPNFRQRPVEDINDADPTTYQFSFELTILQRFESTDVMAIPKTKAP